jgi:hypothetical protein
VVFGSRQIYEGYRYASAAELTTLLIDAGITPNYGGSADGEFANYENFLALLGPTFYNGREAQIIGFTNDYGDYTYHDSSGYPCESCNVADVIAGLSDYWPVGTPSWEINRPICGVGNDCYQFYDENIGSFLVRNVVTPLPAALPLFATGLGAFGLLGWRRKRKVMAALAA